VVDLRWLAPLDEQGIIEQVSACQHVLIVDECRKTGSISEAIITLLHEAVYAVKNESKPTARITAEDSFIPLGSAANHVLPSAKGIVDAALSLVGHKEKNNANAKVPS